MAPIQSVSECMAELRFLAGIVGKQLMPLTTELHTTPEGFLHVHDVHLSFLIGTGLFVQRGVGMEVTTG